MGGCPPMRLSLLTPPLVGGILLGMKTSHLKAGNMLSWNRAKTVPSKKRVRAKDACRKATVRKELRRDA